jgi:hypothetical protein
VEKGEFRPGDSDWFADKRMMIVVVDVVTVATEEANRSLSNRSDGCWVNERLIRLENVRTSDR